MKFLYPLTTLILGISLASCSEAEQVTPEDRNWDPITLSCPEERTLETYENQEAIVTESTQGEGTNCLLVDPQALAGNGHFITAFLVQPELGRQAGQW